MPLGNQQIVRKLFKEFLTKGNLAVADEIIAANHVHHRVRRFGEADGLKRVARHAIVRGAVDIDLEPAATHARH